MQICKRAFWEVFSIHRGTFTCESDQRARASAIKVRLAQTIAQSLPKQLPLTLTWPWQLVEESVIASEKVESG